MKTFVPCGVRCHIHGRLAGDEEVRLQPRGTYHGKIGVPVERHGRVGAGHPPQGRAAGPGSSAVGRTGGSASGNGSVECRCRPTRTVLRPARLAA